MVDWVIIAEIVGVCFSMPIAEGLYHAGRTVYRCFHTLRREIKERRRAECFN